MAFAVIVGCATGAGKLLALGERPNGSTAFDSSITSWVVAHRTEPLTSTARLFSTLGSQLVLAPVTALLLLALLVRRRIARAALLALAWAGAIGLYSLTKTLVHRERPPQRIWLTHAAGPSFPSGHATQSLATLIALALVLTVGWPTRRWPALLLAAVIALAVGWSRVYLGVHWTTDVLTGWVIALAWVASVVCLRRLKRRPVPARSPEAGPP